MAFQSFEGARLEERLSAGSANLRPVERLSRFRTEGSNATFCGFDCVKYCGRHERGGKDFARFLRIASGSCAELRTQVYIAKKIEIIEQDDFSELISEFTQISKMLNGLRKSLKTEN